jgi:pyrroloquinoline quinone (PQQ) biosynthesis protein C
MPTAIEAAAPAAGFADALRRAIDVAPAGEPRLCRLLARPDCPPRVLQGFARGVLAGAQAFPGLLATLIEHAPDAAAQMVLTRNLLAEEGMCLVPGRGLVCRPELRHVDWARAFARACGCDDAAPAAAFALDAEVLAGLGERDGWLRAVAYFLLGQEGSFAQVCPALERALRRHGLPAEALVFFERHAEQDVAHGDEALQLLLAHAHDAAQRRLCLDAARRGAERWFAQYR